MSAPEAPPDSPLSARRDALGELLRTSNAEFAANIDRQASLRRLEARLNQPARVARWPLLAFAPALALLAWFAWSRVPAHEHGAPHAELSVPAPATSSSPLEQETSFANGKTALPDGSLVAVSTDTQARWRRTTRGIRVRLSRGQVRCAVSKQHGDQRFVVETGGYAFVVLGTELSVRNGAGESQLEVASGRVEVRRGNDTLAFVSAGGSWRGPVIPEAVPARAPEAHELPAAPAASTPQPSKSRSERALSAHEPAAQAVAEDCAALVRGQAFAAADACYGRAAQGSGLSAELALVELSRVRLSALHDAAGALSALEEHRRRFPTGALARQVEPARVRALAALGRYDEAMQALEPMIARGGPQAAELEALRAELARKRGGR